MKASATEYRKEKLEKERLAKIAREKKETFVDKDTNLMWQDSSKNVERTWQSAIDYCKDLNYAGYNDWRLPTYYELIGIVDYSRYNPAIKRGFKNTVSNRYWSSEYVSDSGNAWYVYFKGGYSDDGNKSGNLYVRCVRAG